MKFLHAPVATDNKYSRGVVGLLTGSTKFPGAAILSCSAAARFGVGMVRFSGEKDLREQVVAVRPEVVVTDLDTNEMPHCDAWVVGSGMPVDPTGEQCSALRGIARHAAQSHTPLIIDAGALELIPLEFLGANCLLTPHVGEAQRLLARFDVQSSRSDIEADAVGVATQLANLTGAVVLLKGSRSVVTAPGNLVWRANPAPAELATAGTGDVLAGLLGALVAANPACDLFEVAKFGIWLHAQAAFVCAQSGPIAALDLTEAIRSTVGQLLEHKKHRGSLD